MSRCPGCHDHPDGYVECTQPQPPPWTLERRDYVKEREVKEHVRKIRPDAWEDMLMRLERD